MSNIVSSLGYTDILMISGIAVIAVYLWKSSRSRQTPTMVDLKKLKVLPTENNLGSTQSAAEKSLIEKMKASGKSIVIFFGSQTGTGEEFAQRLAKNARLYGLKALVVDPEEVDLVMQQLYFVLSSIV